MDQKRTGAFIALNRKKHNYIQKQLGDLLGVSDKSVSKWERGICLPDISLFKPLCEILEIDLNELFIGEYITGNDQEILEEHLLPVIYKNMKITKARKIFSIISLFLVPLIILQKNLWFNWVALDSEYAIFRNIYLISFVYFIAYYLIYKKKRFGITLAWNICIILYVTHIILL